MHIETLFTPLRIFYCSYKADQLMIMKIKGSAFLWHQIRCMVAILFLIGQGFESPNVRNLCSNIGFLWNLLMWFIFWRTQIVSSWFLIITKVNLVIKTEAAFGVCHNLIWTRGQPSLLNLVTECLFVASG